jgi:hypothetical protein
MARFRASDELGNDWSPLSYKEGNATNVKRRENAFYNFNFSLMTRTEVNFLHSLAEGKNPYPKSALKEYNRNVPNGTLTNRNAKHNSNNWEFVQLFEPEVLQNALNWAPLDQELYGPTDKLNEQINEYKDFYSGIFPLDKNERYGGQQPDVFILGARRVRRSSADPFSTPSGEQIKRENLIVGNLDRFIKAGIDPDLPKSDPFYGRIIPPRELVYYIRRKYGISSAPNQTSVEVERVGKNGNRSEFKQYDNQFLFLDRPTFSATRSEIQAYDWALQRIDTKRNRNFKDIRDGNEIGLGRSYVTGGGKTLSEQAFIDRSGQWKISKRNSRLSDQKIGYWIDLCYNSLNTQKLFAHQRAILIIDELNKWGKVVYRGLKSGDIIPVVVDIAKKGEESTILSTEDHSLKESKLTSTILSMKQKEYQPAPSKVIQYISNIPSDVYGKKNIKDREYHIRPWNEYGGAIGPLFTRPEYSSDFDSPDSSDCNVVSGDRYFMRNLIRPKIQNMLNPTLYSDLSDKNEFALYLTLSELNSRLLKELPFLESPLLNKDYSAIRNISINLDKNGKPINTSGVVTSDASKKDIKEYLNSTGFDYSLYKLKKQLVPYIIGTIAGLALAHELFHSIEQGIKNQQGVFFRLASILDENTFITSSKIGHVAHSLSDGIHAFEKYLEPVLVGFKVVSALANVSLYNDTASYVALVKEISLGGLALENVFKETLRRVIVGGSNLLWVGIILGISLWVDSITTNIRQKEKQEKFKKLFDEAHRKGYIEGVYAESGGDVRILKKDVKGLKLSSSSTSTSVGEPTSYEDSYIKNNQELMGEKGKRLFWDRISKNPIDCKTLLEIAGSPKSTPGSLLVGKYNSLLNQAPNQKDYGVFTLNKDFSVDGSRNILIPGSYTQTTSDRIGPPYINAKLASGIEFNFKYTRLGKNIQNDTDLTGYLTGVKEKSEGKVVSIRIPGEVPGGGSIVYKLYPYIGAPTNKEKVWLIRKKYGLDLINPEAGFNCCNAKKPIDSQTPPIGFPSSNIKGDSDKPFLTGTPALKIGAKQTYRVGCEYLVDLADPAVINKLREICSKKKEVDKKDKTPNKKTSTSPKKKTNTPVLSYTREINEEVTNNVLINYITQVGNSAQTLYQQKGGDTATAGTDDPSTSVNALPRFGQKAAVELFAQSSSPVPSTSVSRWLVGFATMDIHSDLRRFVNTIGTSWASSHSSNPVNPDKIDNGALDTPIESNGTIDSTFGTATQGPPRTRG